MARQTNGNDIFIHLLLPVCSVLFRYIEKLIYHNLEDESDCMYLLSTFVPIKNVLFCFCWQQQKTLSETHRRKAAFLWQGVYCKIWQLWNLLKGLDCGEWDGQMWITWQGAGELQRVCHVSNTNSWVKWYIMWLYF